MPIPVCVFVADHRLPELRVFLHLYEKYWNWPLIVFGFKRPEYSLKNIGEFVSLGDMADYPADHWSDAVIKALEMLHDKFVIVLLEDYWLTRKINQIAVIELGEYMEEHPNIVRGDLTTDRLYAENLVDVEPWGMLDIIANNPPAPYHFSTQAAIWRRESLLHYLKPGETPWQSELNGTSRMMEEYQNHNYPAFVVGTRQSPVRYRIAVQGGKLMLDGGYQVPMPIMSLTDQNKALELMGIDR